MHSTWLTLPYRKLRLKFAIGPRGSAAWALDPLARWFRHLTPLLHPTTVRSYAGRVAFRTVLPDRRYPACDISDFSAASPIVAASSARPSAAGNRRASRSSRPTAARVNIRRRPNPDWINRAGASPAEEFVVMPFPAAQRGCARHPHVRICVRVSVPDAGQWLNPSRRFRRSSEDSPRTAR